MLVHALLTLNLEKIKSTSARDIIAFAKLVISLSNRNLTNNEVAVFFELIIQVKTLPATMGKAVA